MLDLKKKEKIVSELKKQISEAKGLWLTDFTGLEATTVTRLRKTLRESNIPYKVVKNTLLERALKGTEYEELNKYIKGPVGLCFGEDIVKGSRVLIDFQKESEKFTLKEAWLDGKIYESGKILKIAQLPSREVLIGQILNVFTASQVRLVNVLNGILISFVSVVNELSKKPVPISQPKQDLPPQRDDDTAVSDTAINRDATPVPDARDTPLKEENIKGEHNG